MTNDNQPVDKEMPIEAIHRQEFTKGRELTLNIPASHFDAFVTGLGRGVGIFFMNEQIKISEIIFDGNNAEIHGTMYKQEIN